MHLFYPRDPLDPPRVDETYEDEYGAVRALHGLDWPGYFINSTSLAGGERGSESAVQRGRTRLKPTRSLPLATGANNARGKFVYHIPHLLLNDRHCEPTSI